MYNRNVPVHSARLTRGTLSTERFMSEMPFDSFQQAPLITDQHQLSIETAIKEVQDVCRKRIPEPPAPLEVSEAWFERPPEDTAVIERPAWQAFLTTVQLHNLDLAEELEPAHSIGAHTQKRVILPYEGIDALNFFIDQWYGKEVEIVTTLAKSSGKVDDETREGASFGCPYRPVTGLKVIVTTTEQWSRDPYDYAVLRERERWGWLTGVSSIQEAHRLYVRGKRKVKIEKEAQEQSGNELEEKWGQVKRKMSDSKVRASAWIRKRV